MGKTMRVVQCAAKFISYDLRQGTASQVVPLYRLQSQVVPLYRRPPGRLLRGRPRPRRAIALDSRAVIQAVETAESAAKVKKQVQQGLNRLLKNSNKSEKASLSG